MPRFLALVCLFACLVGPVAQDCQAGTVLDDVNDTLTKLNPISGAISSLIGQAAGAGNTILQERLEQLNGIIQLAIQQLNEAAKERIDQLDEKTTKQLGQLNRYVQENLLQFDYLVNHNLQDADTFLAGRINQFNEGVANTICSVSLLKTTPLLRVGETGITTYKQVGTYTTLYIPGSCLAKYSSAPDVYVSGDNVPRNLNTLFKGTAIDKVYASSALIVVPLPNSLLPETNQVANLILHLKFSMGWFSGSQEQAIPLHVCGIIPKLTAHFRAAAIGKAYQRDKVPYPSSYPGMIVSNGVPLAHSSTPSGNGNNTVNLDIPPSPREGWVVDMSSPDYGLVYAINDKHNHWDLGRLPNHGLHLYTEGSEGDAWLNVAVSVKVMKTVDQDPCAPAVEWDLPLPYGPANAVDIHDKIDQAVGTACAEARNEMIPVVSTRVEIFDSSHISHGSAFMKQNIPVEFLNRAVKLTLDNDNHLAVLASPYCDSSFVPVTK